MSGTTEQRKAGGVDIALDAADLEGLSEADLKARYEESTRRRGTHEDFSGDVQEEMAKRRKGASCSPHVSEIDANVHIRGLLQPRRSGRTKAAQGAGRRTASSSSHRHEVERVPQCQIPRVVRRTIERGANSSRLGCCAFGRSSDAPGRTCGSAPNLSACATFATEPRPPPSPSVCPEHGPTVGPPHSAPNVRRAAVVWTLDARVGLGSDHLAW